MNGWEIVREEQNKLHFRRPGKSSGNSATFLKDKRTILIFTTNSDLENRAYVPWHLFVHYRANGDSKRAYHILKTEFKTEKSNRISTSGYLPFKDKFFKELRKGEDSHTFLNEDLYQHYLDFVKEYEFSDFYPRCTIIALLKRDAEFYGFKVTDIRIKQKHHTVFKNSNI